MFHYLRKLPIRTQLFSLAILTGIIMSVIIFAVYFQASKVITINNNEYTGEMLSQIKQGISSNCFLIGQLLTTGSYNRVVQNFVTETDRYKRVELFKDVNSLFGNMQDIKNGIVDFVIISNNGDDAYFFSGRNNHVMEILKNLPEGIKNYYTRKEKIEVRGKEIDCFIVASTLYSIARNKTSGDKIGIAAIVLNIKALSIDGNKKFNESATKFYLLDRSNNVYSSNETPGDKLKVTEFIKYADFKPGRYIAKLNGEKFVVCKDDIPEIDGKIISVVPEKKLFYNLMWMRKLTIFFLIAAIVLVAFIFIIISNNILYPLNKFMRFITFIKSEDLNGLKQRIDLEGYAEIGIMAGEFNSMLDKIDSLTHTLITTSSRLYESELQKKQAELAYLKSQINPHFIYNTLEAMKGTAVDEGAADTYIIAKALGKIFRYSVKGADLVQLYEELEIIKSYDQIQKVRFADRFQIEYKFSEAALNCNVPKMILQPIVENAYYHGLEAKMGKGHLWIEGVIAGNKELHIWIVDDGVGIEDSTIECIRKHLKLTGEVSRTLINDNSNIGICNVNNRIKLIYGEQYGVYINSVQGQGTVVMLKIPARGDWNV